MNPEPLIRRRRVLQVALAAGASAALPGLSDAALDVATTATESTALGNTSGDTDLVIAKQRLSIAGRSASVTTVNSVFPAPLLRFREGEDVTIRVRNTLEETASIHWHGLIVPQNMDGVPGVSFDGIRPGETFKYRLPLRQSGTYWYHSHSGTQEQAGLYGPLIIDPLAAAPFTFEREFVVLLSDWTFEDPMRVLAKIKEFGPYYNFSRRTVADLFRDAGRNGWGPTFTDRVLWAEMRMDPTDIADITGYTLSYLLNGQSPDLNWTGIFNPGERIRLRFINAGANTFFDVRIPGLPMTLVQADGQDIEPVTIEEFRMAPAETYDMIVKPDAQAYAIFAEAMDRSGYAAGTLAPQPGMRAAIPATRVRPLRTMADMGMAPAAMGGMAMPAAKAASSPTPVMPSASKPADSMAGMTAEEMAPPTDTTVAQPKLAATQAHGPDHHGPGNTTVAEMAKRRVDDPGTGLGADGRRVLVYTDLRRLIPLDAGVPKHQIELHLTGNMERQIWGFDGKKYSEAKQPIQSYLGESMRVTLVNDTMMDHPIHLHGMWMRLENGAGANRPLKHTINVKAGELLTFDIEPGERGKFAFHCHLLFHMELGMFRVVSVVERDGAVPS